MLQDSTVAKPKTSNKPSATACHVQNTCKAQDHPKLAISVRLLPLTGTNVDEDSKAPGQVLGMRE